MQNQFISEINVLNSKIQETTNELNIKIFELDQVKNFAGKSDLEKVNQIAKLSSDLDFLKRQVNNMLKCSVMTKTS